MNLENKKYWVWFSLIKKLGSIRKQKLLSIYKEPIKIYNLKKTELKQLEWLSDEIIENIIDIETKKQTEKHIEKMYELDIDIITIKDKEYPKNLKEIYDYPISLYIKGNKEILNNKNIAIIGCREYSEYGKACTLYFSQNLAKENINIISGLERGIDSFSHIGAIKAKGKTIAVVGNGLDTIYPKENYNLEKEIIRSGGAVISEYPIGTKAEKINFPARNRIISGMSDGVVVIEAKKKSGTILTVDFALEQGRDIYAVPGNINNINSTGTNELIKQGAKLITNYKEIDL